MSRGCWNTPPVPCVNFTSSNTRWVWQNLHSCLHSGMRGFTVYSCICSDWRGERWAFIIIIRWHVPSSCDRDRAAPHIRKHTQWVKSVQFCSSVMINGLRERDEQQNAFIAWKYAFFLHIQLYTHSNCTNLYNRYFVFLHSSTSFSSYVDVLTAPAQLFNHSSLHQTQCSK